MYFTWANYGSKDQSRFYFADAAAEGYLDIRLNSDDTKTLLQEVTGILEDVNIG